jgi:hypothetical protein
MFGHCYHPVQLPEENRLAILAWAKALGKASGRGSLIDPSPDLFLLYICMYVCQYWCLFFFRVFVHWAMQIIKLSVCMLVSVFFSFL